MDIKPIETIYNGYRFRSRLEARWAVFFDKAGIEYVYEPEGYDLGDGTYYLPDFYLPKVLTRDRTKGLYVEVKGVMSKVDEAKIEKFWRLGYGSEWGHYTSKFPVLIVGEIPSVRVLTGKNTQQEVFLFVSYQDEDPYWNFQYIDGDNYSCRLYRQKNGTVFIAGPDNDHLFPYGYWSPEYEERLAPAYIMARQARFEHGERGAPAYG